MKTEYDERVKDYWKLPNGDYIVQLSLDEDVDTPVDNKNTMPSQLGAFMLSNSRRIMNNFVEVIDGFKTMYFTKILIVCISKRNIGTF